jgi:hypothetical protein
MIFFVNSEKINILLFYFLQIYENKVINYVRSC